MMGDAWKSADYRAEHFLWNLDDRVATVGGTLAIDSPVGGGTRLEARMPL